MGYHRSASPGECMSKTGATGYPAHIRTTDGEHAAIAQHRGPVQMAWHSSAEFARPSSVGRTPPPWGFEVPVALPADRPGRCYWKLGTMVAVMVWIVPSGMTNVSVMSTVSRRIPAMPESSRYRAVTTSPDSDMLMSRMS